jgi:hypothetical protein
MPNMARERACAFIEYKVAITALNAQLILASNLQRTSLKIRKYK